jgi:hypothetical protein
LKLFFLGGGYGYWLLAVGCWLLAVGCWLMAIGYWILAIGYWLPAQLRIFFLSGFLAKKKIECV